MNGQRWGPIRPGRIAVVAVAVAIVPFVAVIASRAGRGWFPVEDLAVIALRSRDVTTARFPLTGAWSRLGFAHPGPVFYWYLGVPSALTGGAPWSLVVGASVAHITAVVVAARLAWVRGGLLLTLLVLAVMDLAYLAVDPWALIAPWNIYLAYPYYAVFLLLAWSVAVGDVRRIPWLAIVATILVQTHVGYVIPVAGPLLWVTLRLVRSTRRDLATWRRLRRPLGWAALWISLLWLPVLVDQLFVSGNLGATWDYFSHAGGDAAGPITAAGWIASQFRWVPPWLGGSRLTDLYTVWAGTSPLAWLFIPAALLVITALAARRRAISPDRRALVALALVAVVSAWIAMARLTGGRAGYLFEWRTFVALFLVLACVWASAPALADRARLKRAATVGVALAIVVASLALTRRVLVFPRVLSPSETLIKGIVTATMRHGTTGTPLVRAEGRENLGVASALIDQLDRRGVPVRVDGWRDFEYGRRTITPDRAASIWLVTEEGWTASRLRKVQGAQLLAANRALPPGLERELEAGQRTLWTQLRRAGRHDAIASLDNPYFALIVAGARGIDHRLAERVSTLNRRALRHATCRCAVFRFPTDHRTLRRIARFELPPPP